MRSPRTWCGPPAAMPPSPPPAWEIAGCAAPQMRHPLGSAALFPSSRRLGAPRAGVGPIANFRSRRRGRDRFAAPAAASPRFPPGQHSPRPSWASRRVGSGHAPAGVLPLPGRGHRLPERARPSPGKPGPRPRPLLEAAAPTPPARGRGAGAAGIAATRRSRSAGRGLSAPTGEAPGPAPQGGAARLKGVGFRLCPSRPLQSLGDPWKREGVGPARVPLGGRAGGYTALTFLC